VVGGVVQTSQLWAPDADTESYRGFSLGAFVDAATPRPWLSVRAEGAYTQRGGDVLLDVGGQPAGARLRMGYATLGVHAKVSYTLGPLHVHFAAGPTVDQVLRNRVDASLAQVFDRERSIVLGVAGGGGVGLWLTERVFAQVDVRIVEGLSDAYDGAFTTVRNRSGEVVARVGVPLATLRAR
jgi:hypothetical protein